MKRRRVVKMTKDGNTTKIKYRKDGSLKKIADDNNLIKYRKDGTLKVENSNTDYGDRRFRRRKSGRTIDTTYKGDRFKTIRWWS
jgi:hypothetical protein